MLNVLSILFLATLSAQKESTTDALVASATDQALETMMASQEFAAQGANEVAVEERECAVAVLADGELEPIELNEKNEGLLSTDASINSLVEQQTAQILQQELQDEEVVAVESPDTEDLRLLAKQPSVTISEPPNLEEYHQLPISTEEKYKIANILSTMADNNVFKLLFEKKRLEKLGMEVNHVHPVRFLGTVFSDPRLVNYMHKIRGSGFKWGGFIDGFSQRFAQEFKAGNVNAYIPGLAEHLGVPVTDLQRYINQQDVEGLIVFLMEKSGR